jgi:hypothetical protein
MLDSLARRLDAMLIELPDSTRWFELRFSKTWMAVVAILAMTIITRASAFGDPNYQIDETYYFLIGQRMQAGDLLYVDIWDRKPPGLYLIYRVLAEFSHDFWIVHLAAGASAAATAFLIFRMSRLVAPVQGALFAALCYLLLLPKFGGAGGQSPVLYNLPMALAAWLILDHSGPNRSHRRELLAMFCAGLAITIKQTALFEAAFMGLWLVWCHRSAGIGLRERWGRAIQLTICGGLPTMAYFAWYAANGHLDILWQSVVESNFARQYNPDGDQGLRLILFAVNILLPLGAALLAITQDPQRLRDDSKFRFLVFWLGVAIAGFLVVPNKFDFYLLPIFLPLAAVSSSFFGRRHLGSLIFISIAISFPISAKSYDFNTRHKSRQELEHLSNSIRINGESESLFVYSGPVFLYSMNESKPLIKLAFPPHLYERSERNSSPFDTENQVRTAIAAKPYSVVMEKLPRKYDNNDDIDAIVHRYLNSCKRKSEFGLRNIYTAYTVVHYYGCGSD